MATKQISENAKIEAVGVLKKRINGENDKNIKVCLSNLVDKIVGRKAQGPADQNQATNAKTQFYKKYLITN